MQKIFRRIGAFLLAILVWVATSSFSLSMHYCGNKMVSYSTVGKAKPCCKISSLQFSGQENVSSILMSCCKDKQLDKESEDELTFSITKAEVENTQLLLLLPQLIGQEFNLNALSSVKPYAQTYDVKSHSFRDRYVLFQVFLI